MASCESDSYDLVIQNGIIYDGSGSESESVDIGIIGNQIVKVGKINSKNSPSWVPTSIYLLNLRLFFLIKLTILW